MLLDSVHMPIGLKIGAATPEEIAVSIIAEMIQCRRSCTEDYYYSSDMQKMLAHPAEDIRRALANHYRQERLRTEGGGYEDGCAGRRKNHRYHRRRLRRGGSNYESALLYAGRE